MRVGTVIDRSFSILRREWRAAVVVAAVVVTGVVGIVALVLALVVVTEVETGVAIPGAPSGLAAAVAITAFGLFVVAYAIAGYVANGIAVRAGVTGPEEGTDWSGLALHTRPALRATLRLLGWALLAGLAVAAVFAGLVGLAVAGGEVGVPVAVALLVVVGMALLALSLLAAPHLLVTVAVVYVDEVGVPEAVRRAIGLVRGRFWPALGATLVLWLFSLVPVVGGILVAVLTPAYQAALLVELGADA